MIIQLAIFRDIQETKSLVALWSLAMRFFRSQGFEAGTYILMEQAKTSSARVMFSYGVPQGVMDTYLERDGRFHDPLVRAAMDHGLPQTRSSFHGQFELTPEEAALVAHMLSLEFVDQVADNVVIPVYGPKGHNAACRLDIFKDSQASATRDLDALQMVAQKMHLKALSFRQQEEAEQVALSRRETEILQWVAQGKSNSVIGAILGISAGTVDTYLRRIFDKLQVSDRTTAAIKGVSRGYIRI